MKRTIFALLAIVGSASAFGVVLDDFSAGSFYNDSNADFYVTENLGAGLIRYGQNGFNTNPNNRYITSEVAGGQLFIEAETGVDGGFVYGHLGAILNGAPTSGPGGLPTVDAGSFATAVNLTSTPLIELVFTASDQANATVEVWGYEKSGTGLGTFDSSSALAIPQGGGTVTFDISTTSLDLSNIGAWGFTVYMPTGNDVAITQVNAVPEPATLIALGAGLAAFARRRKAN